MAAALQRNNFRDTRDGARSPLAAASMSAGAASMGGRAASGSGFHTEFPARQRKRLQVGATNLSKSSSSPEVGPLPVAGPAALTVSGTLHRVTETNIALVKASMQRSDPLQRRVSLGNEGKPLVLRTELRRLSALTPTRSSRSKSVNQHQIPGWQRSRGRALHSSDGVRPLEHSITAEKTAEHAEEVVDASHRPFSADSYGDGKAMKTTTRQNEDQTKLTHNRVKLYGAFMEKYGSMRAVFRAFDRDGNGLITAQRFQDMVEAAEVELTAEETRTIYKSADINGDNAVTFHEFAQLFAPLADAATATMTGGASAYSPEKDPAGPTRDPGSSLALKYRTPLELSPRSRRRMQQLRKQVIDELHRKDGQALGVHGGKPGLLLEYAFKSMDIDNDGFLSYSEVEAALGHGFLHLDAAITPTDMREMLQLMDHNGDEQINLREFAHYFAAGDRELPTDLIDNARKKELAALHVKRSVDLTPRDIVDPNFALRRSLMLQKEQQPSNDPSVVKTQVQSARGCLPEQLCRRTAAIIQQDRDRSVVPPTKGDCIVKGTLEQGLSSSQSQSAPSLQFEFQERPPATSSDAEGPIVAMRKSISPDRFYHRRRERTDWTRVGVGGDGTRPDTGLYQSSHERFLTTNSEVYTPLYRAPGSATCGDGGDAFAMARASKATATVEADARRIIREARHDHTERLVLEHEQLRIQAARLTDWKTRANVRKGAAERFCYLDRLQDREQRVAVREGHMQRRHGGASFLRMWAGSADSQFNDPQNQ